MNRIVERFGRLQREGRKGFVVYIGAGDPNLDATRRLALAFDRLGVDVLELGVPFSDPLADGLVNQLAAQRGLEAGTTPAKVLETVSAIRRDSQIPIVLIAFILVTQTWAADWPQFRGPQASGVDTNSPAPTTWDLGNGKNVRWQTNLPGLAHSSPILWGDRIYVTTAVRPGTAELKVGLYGDIEPVQDQQPHEWHLIALEKSTGKTIWDSVGPKAVPRVQRHPKSSHCNSTPATDGRRVVAIFGSEGLFCFDMAGKLMWQKDLGPMDSGYFAVPTAQWGFASSPLIHDGKVVVLCDVQTNSFVAVYDLVGGRQLWKTPRVDVPTWGSPAIAQSGDLTEILVNGWHETAGYDFATGKQIWKLDGGGDIPVPTPVLARGFAYFTSAHGRGRPIRAIRLDAKGDITPARLSETNAAIAWVQERLGNYMQTPIVVGDFIFACFDAGILTCLDADTGKVKFSERLGNGSEGFTASPVSDGRNLYITSEVGHVYVVPTTGAFSVTATNTLGETCMASPALVDGTLYFRARDKLVAIGSKP